jgi:hypothetical protein
MPHREFDRGKLSARPLSERRNRLVAEEVVMDPERVLRNPPEVGDAGRLIRRLAERVRRARKADAPVILAFGAHAIKNGLSLVMLRLARDGWITHFATNGAGSIHDWEFAYLGRTGEDVRANVANGTFGLWEETGRIVGLAVAVGALEGRGYGESVGAVIDSDRLLIPSEKELRKVLAGASAEKAAAAADLLDVVLRLALKPGEQKLPHRWKHVSLQGGLFRLGVPLTVHPGIGYDIIYEHPAASGGVYGRAGYRDFLVFAEAVRRLSGGVYLSVGSSVMSPMIFEKALSMAQNVGLKEGKGVSGHYICVNDLAPATWDWRQGEPPEDDPAYYLRYCKSFSRMGGEMDYVCLDNRAFLGRLCAELG